MASSKLINSEKGHVRSTLTLGARKSGKVKGHSQGHMRLALFKQTKWRWFRVSILIRTEVMAQKVFLTFAVTLTLNRTRF